MKTKLASLLALVFNITCVLLAVSSYPNIPSQNRMEYSTIKCISTGSWHFLMESHDVSLMRKSRYSTL